VASLQAENSLAVGGLADVERILEEVENGKLGDIHFLECHACPQGCCGGPLTVDNTYVTRSKILRLIARFGSTPCQDRERIRELYGKGYFSLSGTIPSRPFAPLDKDIGKAIEKRKRIQECYETLPQIDCGACGAPTCRIFAEDVVLARAKLEECPVLTTRQVRSEPGGEAGPPGDPGAVMSPVHFTKE
jgi:hypothetical protein